MAARRHVGGTDRLLLLAVETSCRSSSVAVLRGERVLAEVRGAAGRTGAESLLPGVDAALRRAELSLGAIEAFAVSIGPGSFTGLRVGVATVKGLAFGTDRPVVPVPTLAVLALCAPAGEQPVVALLDARRGELYAAAYRLGDPGGVPLAVEPGEGVYTPEELAPRLPPACVLVGEGVALLGDRIRKLRGPEVSLGPADDPRARDVGLLGLRLLAAGRALEAEALVPRYVRRAEAEVKRTGQRFE